MTTCPISVLSECFVLDPRPRLSFRVVAKRYWIKERPGANDHAPTFSGTREGPLTLIFIHGSGTHKEHWEPTIQRLFELQRTRTGPSVRFHDMWALDLLNHGDAAVINEDVLGSLCDGSAYDVFSWENHARAVHAFLSGLGTGVDVDFSQRTLVLIGHSLGAVIAMLASTYCPLLKISSLHLIEPSLMGEGSRPIFDSLIKRIGRNDIWSSPEEALQELKVRPAWKIWDDRILKLFVEHGLRPLPTAEYPDLKGVTLKLTKKFETANARDYKSCIVAYKLLPHLLKEVPTHITHGTIADLIPDEWRQDTLHVVSQGISNFASVTRVPGAGHMIIQSHPDAIGDVIWQSLIQSHHRPSQASCIATRL